MPPYVACILRLMIDPDHHVANCWHQPSLHGAHGCAQSGVASMSQARGGVTGLDACPRTSPSRSVPSTQWMTRPTSVRSLLGFPFSYS